MGKVIPKIGRVGTICDRLKERREQARYDIGEDFRVSVADIESDVRSILAIVDLTLCEDLEKYR
jgi:hypothetical protein